VASAIVGGVALAPSAALPARVVGAVVLAGLALVALAFKLPPVASGLVGALGLIAIASALGGAIGSRIEAAGHLAAVALVSSAVDLWSVTSPAGPTHRIVQSPALLRLLTVSVAIPPHRDPVPAIGFGDVVFVALYLAAAARFALPRARMVAALWAGMFAAGALAYALEGPVPALPLIGLMVLATQPMARDVPQADRRATLLAAAMLVASVARACTR
ncbi:MAG: hypothetical protein JWM10_1855, partial [Myxococcaceae bacterium]|nr:hypothetical protein [Myxococcaceae bacterium]